MLRQVIIEGRLRLRLNGRVIVLETVFSYLVAVVLVVAFGYFVRSRILAAKARRDSLPRGGSGGRGGGSGGQLPK